MNTMVWSIRTREDEFSCEFAGGLISLVIVGTWMYACVLVSLCDIKTAAVRLVEYFLPPSSSLHFTCVLQKPINSPFLSSIKGSISDLTSPVKWQISNSPPLSGDHSLYLLFYNSQRQQQLRNVLLRLSVKNGITTYFLPSPVPHAIY